MSIETEIRKIFETVVSGFDGSMLQRDGLLLESGLDSLDFATVLLEIQETYGVTLPPGEEDDFDTLGKLVDFVEKSRV